MMYLNYCSTLHTLLTIYDSHLFTACNESSGATLVDQVVEKNGYIFP
jgi:hypothetical protein